MQLEANFSLRKDQAVIADCFRDLNKDALAQHVMQSEIIDQHLTILIDTANKLKRADVLERLYFAGLIYG